MDMESEHPPRLIIQDKCYQHERFQPHKYSVVLISRTEPVYHLVRKVEYIKTVHACGIYCNEIPIEKLLFHDH